MLTDQLLSFNFQRCVAGRPEFLARRSGRRFRFRSASIIYNIGLLNANLVSAITAADQPTASELGVGLQSKTYFRHSGHKKVGDAERA